MAPTGDGSRALVHERERVFVLPQWLRGAPMACLCGCP